MDGTGRQQVQAGMQVFVVVPILKIDDKTFRILDACEELEVNDTPLHRCEYTLRERVVVAGVRPAVARHYVQFLE